MPRKPRIDYPGAFHHVWARGVRRQTIFFREEDYRFYLAMLHRVRLEFAISVHAYVLLANHIHLLLETPHANLSKAMKQQHQIYAAYLNDRRELAGHAFQGRFGSRPLEDAEIEIVFSYLAYNPVKAGLCAEPEQYEWSSYGAARGLRPPARCLTMRLAATLTASPPRPRPPLDELSPAEARREGYTLRAIAEHHGLSLTTVHRQLGGTKGSDP
jgi:putative transposase